MAIGLGIGIGISIGSRGSASSVPSPTQTLDFVNNIFERNGVLYPTFADFLADGGGTFTRASAGYDLRGFQSFAIDTPRITNYGLLLEPAATNLMIQSNLATGWTNDNSTISANSVAAPDGTTTAATITENGSTSVHGAIRQLSALSLSNGSRYILSVYAKRTVGTRNLATQLFKSSFGASGYAGTNLANGALAYAAAVTGSGWTVGEHSSMAAANSFYRAGVSVVSDADTGPQPTFRFLNGAGNPDYFVEVSYAGDSASAVALWCAQLELAAASGYFAHKPSSPILTTTAAASRSADALAINIPDGLTSALVTFDDDSTQTVNGLSGTWNVPTTLDRPEIKSIVFS